MRHITFNGNHPNNNVYALSFLVKFNEDDPNLTFSKGMGMNKYFSSIIHLQYVSMNFVN